MFIYLISGGEIMFLMNRIRRMGSVVLFFLGVIYFILCTSSALAKETSMITTKTGAKFPTKEITIVCWGKEGAPLDITTRMVGDMLEKEIGQRVFVENRPGGRGANGFTAVLSRPADGYTILAGTSSYSFYMAGRKEFSPDQFTPLTPSLSEAGCIFVRADSPYKNIKELIEDVRANPNKLAFGVNPIGSTWHFAAWSFAKGITKNGLGFRFVPYESTAEINASVLGGHTDLGCSAPSSAASLQEAGKVRILAVMGKKRWEGSPDTPTLKELGYDVEVYIWRGMWVKSGTPEEITNFLHDGLRKAMQREKFVQWRKSIKSEDFSMERDKFEKLVQKSLGRAFDYLRELGLIK